MYSNMGIAAWVEAEIVRFHRAYRRRLRKMVVVSPRLADLLKSFPAVAFALVSQHGSASQRGRAIELVKRGAPLSAVAVELQLPNWMRKLPPEAFVEPFGDVPSDEMFAKRVVPLIPRDLVNCSAWLIWMLAGYRNCDARFAIWLGSQRFLGQLEHDGCVPVAPMAAYAWYSARPCDDPARALIRRPWQPSMGFGTAVAETGAWVSRVTESVRPPVRRRGHGRYSTRNTLRGLNFVVLQTRSQLNDEGQVMDHCVGSYADDVARGRCVIVSIRRGARRLATMEVIPRKRDAVTSYAIAQLLGPANAPAPAGVYRDAYNWVSRNADKPLSAAGSPAHSVDERAWARVWEPYVSLKGRAYGEDADFGVMRLVRDVEQLERFA